jgi:acid phosphatase (class A)
MCRIVLLFSLIALPLFSQTPRPKPFVTADQLDVKVLLPNPPASEKELPEVLHVQETRQPADIAHAKADDAEEDMFIFRNVLGDKFNADALPLTAALSARVHANEGVILNPAKQYFRRLRPFNFDHAVKPVCKVKDDVNDYGYPSGHSTSGYLEALVVMQIVPEKRNEILARADDYAHSRVVCGVHYPSDTQAAKMVAYAMLGLMMNNPEFQKELAAAKAETRRTLFSE